jgi:AcrR family transcriptional regulator
MTPKRKTVEEGTSTREAILDAAEQIMLEEGYAAISSRKVAGRAGTTSQLLHYYFRTMDDLFIAVFQRMEDKYDEQFARAIASDDAIRELWKLSMNAASTSLIHEFKALATHRKAIRALIARSGSRDRRLHAAAFARIVEQRDISSEDLPPPMVLALLMASVARTLVTETALGIPDGHAEMLDFIERHLSRMESLPRRPTSSDRLKSGGDPAHEHGATPTKSRKRIGGKSPK